MDDANQEPAPPERECDQWKADDYDYDKVGCRLFYIDNPHPSWFGSRAFQTTATGGGVRTGISPYSASEQTDLQKMFYPDFKLQKNMHMERGTFQERGILEKFCERRRLKLMQVALMTHPHDVRLGATPDGLGLAESPPATEPNQRRELVVYDLEAKCPMKETVDPPMLYLAQMSMQMQAMELDRAFLITHSASGVGRCWLETITPEFARWIHRGVHRSMQYEACGISDRGAQWSSRGLRGFAQAERTDRPPRNLLLQNDPSVIESTTRRMASHLDGNQLLLDEMWTAEICAPVPEVAAADSYKMELPPTIGEFQEDPYVLPERLAPRLPDDPLGIQKNTPGSINKKRKHKQHADRRAAESPAGINRRLTLHAYFSAAAAPRKGDGGGGSGGGR